MLRGRITAITLGLLSWGAISTPCPALADDDTVAGIEADFDRELIELEKVRLRRLASLAATKTGVEADRAYEACFRVAIESNLYAEAQPAAEKAASAGGLSPRVQVLAHLVDIVAHASRGEHEASLKKLQAAIGAGGADRKALPAELKLSLLDAYYQRLVQGGQFDVARRALETLQGAVKDPAVKDMVGRRLAQVNLVGKDAPAIQGTDVDGNPFLLADAKGHPVLVVFWATWCLPNALEVAALDEAYKLHGDKGLEIVGINLDAFAQDAPPMEAIAGDVRRYLIERNVRWPNLIDRPGEGSLAGAYGVTDIPSNVLVGKDGKVVQIDLTAANLKSVLARELDR